MAKLFSKWFYISILLILSGLVISQADVKSFGPSTQYLVNLLSQALKDIGLAVFISNLFSFIIGTAEFVAFVRNKLIEIVVSHEFVAKLNQGEQEKLLGMVLRPPKEFSEVYSGINDYFKEYVGKSLLLFDKNFRGHLVLDAVASYDPEKRCTKIEIDLDYTVYSVSGRFDDIPIFSQDEKLKHVRTVVIAPNGAKSDAEDQAVCARDKIQDPTLVAGYEMKIPEEFSRFAQVNVHREIVEYGSDHWQQFVYKAVKPCHGLLINLRCLDGLIVRSCNVWGSQKSFIVERSKHNDHIRVFCNQWLEPGFGVDVVVSKKKSSEIEVLPATNEEELAAA